MKREQKGCVPLPGLGRKYLPLSVFSSLPFSLVTLEATYCRWCNGFKGVEEDSITKITTHYYC